LMAMELVSDLEAALAAQRPALLRHCYRMLGAYAEAEDLTQDALARAWGARATFRGTAPLSRWLFTIATNACLNALARRERRTLPQLELEPASEAYEIVETEAARWVTPAPDERLFDPSEAAESREAVALSFIALLQHLPPKQRAVLVLKDVLGWPAEDVAQTLELSLASVHSALHRARKGVARPRPEADPPSRETVESFVRAWASRDLDGLVALFRQDVALSMPPYALWFSGVESVVRFLRSPRFSTFWASLTQVIPTRANGLPAFIFYRATTDGSPGAHSVMVARFRGERVAEMTTFVGASFFAGFSRHFGDDRTVPGSSAVMRGNK
jgi:RNA polymerase sigma-70 factor, ECF subfamily